MRAPCCLFPMSAREAFLPSILENFGAPTSLFIQFSDKSIFNIALTCIYTPYRIMSSYLYGFEKEEKKDKIITSMLVCVLYRQLFHKISRLARYSTSYRFRIIATLGLP